MTLTSPVADMHVQSPPEVVEPPVQTSDPSPPKRFRIPRPARYVGVIAAAWVLAELAARVGVPAPSLLAALVLGVAVRMTAVRGVAVPADVSRWTQAFIGVMLGGYLNVDAIRAVGPALAPFVAVSVLTIALSLVLAWALSRWSAGVDRPTAILGLMAGGSSAVVTMCDDFGARKDVVGFMQYSRVLIVSASAPFVLVALAGGTAGTSAPTESLFQLVGRGDQVAGLSTAVMLALTGMWLGRRFRIPGGGLIGPMIVAAIIGGTHLSRGFAPQGMFKEILLVVVGLEVGLMFNRQIWRRLARALPAITASIIGMCVMVALLAVGVAHLTGVAVADAYLATTPGGINAVVASASSSADSDMALIATVQSLRLIIVVLALPVVVLGVDRFTRRRARSGRHRRRRRGSEDGTDRQ
ncbi:AbrB family transcriptional regulator [Gordonia neofelifaecis]|uniref:Membrane protein AbrB duplication n=1 Tax=Gordonia neofelifaecis NRRL B-59395 TaxID=644548 RepID=F1YFM0_9ACTN|nr:AbrB family transcriptional regulator [Gordonia neofelifaecis]EGD56404.1 membrane protein AbrB duplication [Gordonia neofelifaecis NRRL B-59395]